jgi:hypothetical protein
VSLVDALSCSGETSFALGSKPNCASDSQIGLPCQGELDRKPAFTLSLGWSLQRRSFWFFDSSIPSASCERAQEYSTNSNKNRPWERASTQRLNEQGKLT